MHILFGIKLKTNCESIHQSEVVITGKNTQVFPNCATLEGLSTRALHVKLNLWCTLSQASLRAQICSTVPFIFVCMPCLLNQRTTAATNRTQTVSAHITRDIKCLSHSIACYNHHDTEKERENTCYSGKYNRDRIMLASSHTKVVRVTILGAAVC